MELSFNENEYNVNIISIIIHFLALYSFDFAVSTGGKFIGVAKRGFFCDDDTIRYEYRPETVTYHQLLLYNILMNAITILIVELYRMYNVRSKTEKSIYRWRLFVIRVVIYFWYSQLGFIINVAINAVTKNSIGRLRPHFLDVCKLANDTCINGDSHRYITNYKCTGSPAAVLEARKSFYSGHSSRSLYSAVWSILYIQARLSTELKNRILVPVLQCIVLSIGMFISFSRISDHMHHWSDVLVGILMGALIAVYTCVYWMELFKKERKDDEIVGSSTVITSSAQSEPDKLEQNPV